MVTKRLLKSVLPPSLHPQGLLTAEVCRRTGLIVQAGPFKGMRYVDASVGSVLVPKLLGIYERELTPAIEELIASAPQTIVDIGAAEGYFAVGLAMRLPQTQIHAFEMTETGRAKLSELAALNGASDRIRVDGKCEPDVLARAVETSGPVAIICDVEGYEATLLDPHAIPKLASVPMLVELHHFAVPDVGDLLKARFQDTHDITEIQALPRSIDEYPYQSLIRKFIPAMYVEFIVNESRPGPMSWLWMKPRVEAV